MVCVCAGLGCLACWLLLAPNAKKAGDFPGLSFRSRDKHLTFSEGQASCQDTSVEVCRLPRQPSVLLGAVPLEPCSPQAQGAVGPVVCPLTPAQPSSSCGHLRSPCSLPALCPSPVKGELRRVDVGGCGPRGAAGPLNPADPGTLAACPEWGPVGRRARCSPPERRLWGVRCGVGDATRCRVQVWAEPPLPPGWGWQGPAHASVASFSPLVVPFCLFGIGLRERVRHSCWSWASPSGLARPWLKSHLLCPAVLGGLASPLQAARGGGLRLGRDVVSGRGTGPSGPAGAGVAVPCGVHCRGSARPLPHPGEASSAGGWGGHPQRVQRGPSRPRR